MHGPHRVQGQTRAYAHLLFIMCTYTSPYKVSKKKLKKIPTIHVRNATTAIIINIVTRYYRTRGPPLRFLKSHFHRVFRFVHDRVIITDFRGTTTNRILLNKYRASTDFVLA